MFISEKEKLIMENRFRYLEARLNIVETVAEKLLMTASAAVGPYTEAYGRLEQIRYEAEQQNDQLEANFNGLLGLEKE